MLVNADAKGLEWVAAVYLSKDEVGYREIINNIDQHTENQKEFNLPTRLIAKTFLFRILYGGSAYSFAHDPDFDSVKGSEEFWQRAIDKFYIKYNGIKIWHNTLLESAMRTGQVVSPTGREYTFSPERNRKGEIVWPRTAILNYPVQGFGADLMVLARILCDIEIKKLKERKNVLPICTVHDSIVYDCRIDFVPSVCSAIHRAWIRIPSAFAQTFGVELDIPMKVEVKYGPNWADMVEFKEI